MTSARKPDEANSSSLNRRHLLALGAAMITSRVLAACGAKGTVHIHLTISVGSQAHVTTQLCFDDALVDSIIAGQPLYDTANTILVETGLTREGLVSIEVSDTGTGIEPEDLPFVFDPFFTTKPTQTSSGLGLASARAAVLEMGGKIAIESTVGRGTRVRVLLPVAESAVSPVLHFFEADVPRPRRALCVADSAVEARRLRDLVDDGEARLHFATCAEALERLAMGEEYDLVLCDASASARNDFRATRSARAPAHLRARDAVERLGHVQRGRSDPANRGGR